MNRPCKYCGGTGVVHLTGVYAETIEELGRNPGINGAELARIIGTTPTAMNNRLVALEAMGLVTGERYGRQRIWNAIPEKRKETEKPESPRKDQKRKQRKEATI